MRPWRSSRSRSSRGGTGPRTARPRARRDGTRPAPRARRRAPVVGVGVSEHDAPDPAEPRRRRPDRGCHRRDPRVEHRHPAVVLDQVDVHHLGREAAADEPDAVGDPLGLGAVDPAAELRARVGELGQARLAGRARRRQEPELPGDVAAVEIGVVVLDQPVADGQHVAALDLDPRPVRLEALERPGPANVPRACQRTAVRCARGGRIQDLEREIGERREQRPKYSLTPSGPTTSSWPTNRSIASGRPARRGGVEVVVVQRLEVALGDFGRGGHRGAAVYAS